jgi:predicted RNA-binding Zn-ribbon protein involved in translation (DUF1610 family)
MIEDIQKYLKILVEGTGFKKCPNCGSVEIYICKKKLELKAVRFWKRVNDKEYSKSFDAAPKGDIFKCSNCGFVWTNKYETYKYSFGKEKKED